MNGGQHANKTTIKIEIKSSNSRGRRTSITATNANQLPKRKVERIVFGI